MEIIKHRGMRIHIGCGGEVVKGRCIKCGDREERRSIKKILFGDGPFIEKVDRGEINRDEHRKRIREGRDIFK